MPNSCSPLQLLSSVTLPAASWRNNIRLVATDMDGTLTEQGKFGPALLGAFSSLKQQGISVLVVTGRSAGWVSGIVNYLDVAGAIAENGGIYYPSVGETSGELLVDIDDIAVHRQKLEAAFTQIQSEFPLLQPATDNRFRLTDWTFTNSGFSASELARMAEICTRLGWGFTYSSIQCHIKPIEQAKGRAVRSMAPRIVANIDPDGIVTVGDSPNDESLFNPDDFSHSVGVANIADFSDRMQYVPRYITSAPEGAGFYELVNWLLDD